MARQHGVRALRYTVQANGEELREIALLLEAGKVKPFVSQTFPLERAADALAAIESGHARGKVVLVVD
jgi:NADPH:quinone reductase-like Zn-dependent oxidoreductase